MKMSKCHNYIDCKPAESHGNEIVDVLSPVDGTAISQIITGNSEDVDRAVDSARRAYEKWSQTTVKQRADVLFNVRHLLKKHMDELSELITLENGKTIDVAIRHLKPLILKTSHPSFGIFLRLQTAHIPPRSKNTTRIDNSIIAKFFSHV